jgi:hypothetical protein
MLIIVMSLCANFIAVHSNTVACRRTIVNGISILSIIATPPPLVLVSLCFLRMFYPSILILSELRSLVSDIVRMSVSCILTNTFRSCILPRSPLAFQGRFLIFFLQLF